MINAAIADGDIVVVRQQSQAENGDIAAAMIDGETTVKTLQRVNGHVWLIPHNPAYEPIPWPVPCDDATIDRNSSLGSIDMMARWEGQTSRPTGIRCPPVLRRDPELRRIRLVFPGIDPVLSAENA
jgi:hypothetical protein